MTILDSARASEGATISTTELRDRLTDEALTIVDVRPLAAYNGWRRKGEARGGHIPGAVAFPTAWLDSVDEAEIERLLDAKGIVAGREIVIYGDGPDDAAKLAAKLESLGIEGARVYDAGAAGWAADETLPIDRLPRYESLVHIAWLRDVLDG
jgi:3-mercaptopyruvate sulfurtransferase SseA